MIAAPGLDDVTALVEGRAHACALVRSGRVFCWDPPTPHRRSEANRHGQRGDLDRTPDRVTEVPGLTDAVELAAGDLHTCARRASGLVTCWGGAGDGQVGRRLRHPETWQPPSPPVTVPGLNDAVALAVGANHSCALRRAGGLVCWGLGAHGQLGDQHGSFRTGDDLGPWPVRLPGRVVDVTLGASHTCALNAAGQVFCWGAPLDRGSGTYPHASGSYGGWGGSYWCCEPGLFGPVLGTGRVVALAARDGRTCTVDDQGVIRCFEKLTATEGAPPPHRPPLQQVGRVAGAVELAVGGARACVRTRSGEVACWGYPQRRWPEAYPDLGQTPARPTVVPLPGGAAAVQLTLGEGHACALLADGQVACWGTNLNGQLGRGTSSRVPAAAAAPVVGLDDAVEVRAGDWHTCARRRHGEVVCWGHNGLGQLADGTRRPRSRPVEARAPGMSPSGSLGLSAAGTTTCSTQASGTVCWP